MRGLIRYLLLTCLLMLPFEIWAKIDLVSLPTREKVQLTIYNSADLTLVRESRNLTMRKGLNSLQFSWANTLIDPTSLELRPLAQSEKITVFDLSFPPRIKQLGLWQIDSKLSGPVPVEISFFTSGISWKAYYLATLNQGEDQLDLEGFVRVFNNSGEDYAKAQTRLVVGKLHTLEEIATLANRYPPYGRSGFKLLGAPADSELKMEQEVRYSRAKKSLSAISKAKEIKKEGISEYFLYTIEGTETIENGWSKRLPSFSQSGIPVGNLYKYEEERFGSTVNRFLSFKNDKQHKLGSEPLPGGLFKVFRSLDQEKHLAYLGQDQSKYIPIDEDVELNLGPARQVVVEPKMINYRTYNYYFNAPGGNISGWDEEQTYQIKAANYRSIPLKVEIRRNFPHQHWDLSQAGEFGEFEKVDLDTVKFTLELPPNSSKTFSYVLVLHHGDSRRQ